ncbi:MAG: hypothetical protein ACRDMX_00380 [Solirubrobacteraceae bacterium]
MSESSLQAPTSPGDAHPPAPLLASRSRALPGALVWWAVAAAVLVVSGLLVVWARTRPGFDPYGWLVWGHQTLRGTLDINAAPSWKPLPYLFTVPFALTGGHEMRLWMLASAAIALAGAIFAGRIAFRLTGAPPQRRWAAWAAGVFAGLALLGIQDYFHYILSSQADPMIVTLCLAAIDAHLCGRRRSALVLGALAGLGRPEVWLPLGVYWLWLWRALPRTRWLLVAVVVTIALLWFGIPALSSRTWFVAGANANDSGRRLTSDQVGGTLSHFVALTQVGVLLAALLAVALAARSRDRAILVLAAGVIAWVIVECAFVLHGWPANERYLFPAGAVTIVLAGICVGRLLTDPPRWPGIRGAGGRWVGAGLVAVLVASMIPAAVSAARTEHRDLREQHVRTAEISELSAVIAKLGGAARLRGCGEPLTRLEYQSTLAYALGDNVSQVGFKYGQAIAHSNPIVMFTPEPTGVGWVVRAMRQVRPSCRSLPTGG